MPNSRATQQDPIGEASPRPANGAGGLPSTRHFVLSDEEATLVHLVSEGLDVTAIAATTGVSDSVARQRLSELASRLALATGYQAGPLD